MLLSDFWHHTAQHPGQARAKVAAPVSGEEF